MALILDGDDQATIIQDSWQRCRDFGLEHSSSPVLECVDGGELQSLQESHHFLVTTTGSEVLPYYQNILSNIECMILLTDNQGRVLNSWGDQRFIDAARRQFFSKGVSWQEQANGTNAIGTALATGQSVQVQRDDHFLKANRYMIGSAAPIYDANRELLGVLDVSSDAYLPQAHTLGMVKLMSQAIENRLIHKRFHDQHFILGFNTNLDTIDSPWAGLIVFNEDGAIVAANRRAEMLLEYELLQANIADIFEYPLKELKNHPEQLAMHLRTRAGYQMHGIVRRPVQQVMQTAERNAAARSTSAKPPQPGDEISLQQLSYGDSRVDRCIRQAERIIEKDIPILIHGETGVGKEVFVNALHRYSSRREHPLMAVNCAAIPAELVESELFGYEKGAFTGASQKGSIGLIRKAHKGTLFLDEIGEMPLKVQARLLRVLQERKVTPLGSTSAYPVDIKLISATNRGLRDDVDAGLFRQDLYYRVSGLNIELPALRDREDKRELFKYVHQQYRMGDQPAELSESILSLFEQHPWPGNIRQLVSVLQVALAMSDQDELEQWHLPDDFFVDLQRAAQKAAATGTVQFSAEAVQPSVQGAASPMFAEPLSVPDSGHSDMSGDEHTDATVQVYQKHGGNISRTAKELGISRNTLYKRLRELGLK